MPEPVERIAVQSLAGDFALPAPIAPRPFMALENLTNPARIGCRHLTEDGSLSGVYHHPQTQLVRLGELPLHRHRTMHQLTPVPSSPRHVGHVIETTSSGRISLSLGARGLPPLQDEFALSKHGIAFAGYLFQCSSNDIDSFHQFFFSRTSAHAQSDRRSRLLIS